MPLLCPQCHRSLVPQGKPPQEVVCPSCGSTIQLDPTATTGWLPQESPQRRGQSQFVGQRGIGPKAVELGTLGWGNRAGERAALHFAKNRVNLEDDRPAFALKMV
jgi:hypothetical protein